MPDFSLTLVLRLTTSKIINDVAKVQIKSEKITPFGGIFHVRELLFWHCENTYNLFIHSAMSLSTSGDMVSSICRYS